MTTSKSLEYDTSGDLPINDNRTLKKSKSKKAIRESIVHYWISRFESYKVTVDEHPAVT